MIKLNRQPSSSSSPLVDVNVETLTSDKVLTNQSPSTHDLTNTGTIRLNIFLPPAPIVGKSFSIINEDNSLGDFLVNNTIVSPGDRYEVFWSGTKWVEL